jgi:hypothetical protein
MTSNNRVGVENKGTNNGSMVGINYGTIINNLTTSKKLPSLIMNIVKSLSSACIECDPDDDIKDLQPFDTEEKINYNCVIQYREIIEMYSTYYTICDNIMNILDNSNSGSKEKILFCVLTWYRQSKGRVILSLKDSGDTTIQIVRNNSDFIFETVMEKINQELSNSDNFSDASIEELTIGLMCFTCYCFMKCKILEKPKK